MQNNFFKNFHVENSKLHILKLYKLWMKRRFSTSFYETTELLQKNHCELKIQFFFQNNRKNIRNQQILQHMRTNVFSFIECMYIHVNK